MSPLEKSRVIRALQSRGHTVGYLGDGINDAAALKDADVGISVDTAVDIAKELADIILLEKSSPVLEPPLTTYSVEALPISAAAHRTNGTLFFNPGSAGPRRFRLPITVGRVTVEQGKLHAEIVELSVEN